MELNPMATWFHDELISCRTGRGAPPYVAEGDGRRARPLGDGTAARRRTWRRHSSRSVSWRAVQPGGHLLGRPVLGVRLPPPGAMGGHGMHLAASAKGKRSGPRLCGFTVYLSASSAEARAVDHVGTMVWALR